MHQSVGIIENEREKRRVSAGHTFQGSFRFHWFSKLIAKKSRICGSNIPAFSKSRYVSTPCWKWGFDANICAIFSRSTSGRSARSAARSPSVSFVLKVSSVKIERRLVSVRTEEDDCRISASSSLQNLISDHSFFFSLPSLPPLSLASLSLPPLSETYFNLRLDFGLLVPLSSVRAD